MEKQHHKSVHQKAPKSSKMLFGHRNRHKCVVRALSHRRIRVLVKEHQKHVVPLVPLAIVFVAAHQNNEKKKNFGWGSFRFCESLSLSITVCVCV
jgi:hypothetical protein